MNRAVETDPILNYHVTAITAKLEEMTIKLNESQVKALWEILEDFLSMKPDSVSLELVCLLLEDLKEKVRKRSRNGKENIQLDEKQLLAFQIWHYHFSTIYELKHPFGYFTLNAIINQIKPIAHAHRINIQN